MSASFSSAARAVASRTEAGSATAVLSIVALSIVMLPGRRFRLERDLLDPPGKGEVTLAPVVRAGRGNRVPADLERLDPVTAHRHVDGPLADELVVHE